MSASPIRPAPVPRGPRAREIHRHLSNAADRLEDAGRVVMDIAVATA